MFRARGQGGRRRSDGASGRIYTIGWTTRCSWELGHDVLGVDAAAGALMPRWRWSPTGDLALGQRAARSGRQDDLSLEPDDRRLQGGGRPVARARRVPPRALPTRRAAPPPRWRRRRRARRRASPGTRRGRHRRRRGDRRPRRSTAAPQRDRIHAGSMPRSRCISCASIIAGIAPPRHAARHAALQVCRPSRARRRPHCDPPAGCWA